MATALRGRAASPIRPGFIVKDVLLGKIPLETGELVAEAAITDLHSAYKEMIRRENALRSKAKRLKGMTYRSFITFFKFSQLLGLVEKVREEPMRYPPPGKVLYRMEMVAGVMTTSPAVRKIYRLSSKGAEDERSWSDLRRAWQEDWPAPQKMVVVVERPPVEKPLVPKKKPSLFPTFKWRPVPTTRQFGLLLRHLEQLNEIGIRDERVVKEVDTLSMKIGDWEIGIEDTLSDARAINNKPAIEKYERWQGHVTDVRVGLIDRDLGKSIESLRKLTV